VRRKPPLRTIVSDPSPKLSASLSSTEHDRLLASATHMLQRAYAPYSKFRVGAAVLTASGNIYTGCNVENASYGLTNCAERSAIFTAVAAEGDSMRIRAIAVVNAQNVPCSPCGGCRQVIFEFGPGAVVLFQGKNGIEESTASALLPAGFTL
jgi:cytidine deaminase